MTPELSAAGIGAGALAFALWANRRGLALLPQDPPAGGRKCHAQALPMAGVVLAGLATSALLLRGWATAAAGAALCALAGYLDDRSKARGAGLPVAPKALAIATAAALAVVAATPAGASLPPHAAGLAVLLAFVVINAVNFLDSANGVAAAVGGLGVLLATGGRGELAVLGYLFLAFLPFNWPRPRALLGDAGALTLGFCLAFTALAHAVRPTGVHWPVLLAPVLLPVLDFAQVVTARLWLRAAPWVGDRRHLTHLALRAGLPHVLLAPAFAGLAAATFVLAHAVRAAP